MWNYFMSLGLIEFGYCSRRNKQFKGSVIAHARKKHLGRAAREFIQTGKDVETLLAAKRNMSDEEFYKMIKQNLKLESIVHIR
jgi:hypothetical protein